MNPINPKLTQRFPPFPNRFCAETAAIQSELIQLYNPGIRFIEFAPEVPPLK